MCEPGVVSIVFSFIPATLFPLSDKGASLEDAAAAIAQTVPATVLADCRIDCFIQRLSEYELGSLGDRARA